MYRKKLYHIQNHLERNFPEIERRNTIMAKTKQEKIASIQEQIQQLKNQEKQLLQQQKEQERKDRTKRLCKHMGLFESLLPDTITLTDEHFKTFLEKTVLTDQSRRKYAELFNPS